MGGEGLAAAMATPLERAALCCERLNASGLLRSAVSPGSISGMRMRDLAGAGRKCHIVVYWGVWRDGGFGRGEAALLDILARLAAMLGDTLAIAAIMQLVVTDTHARLNGVAVDRIDARIEEVRGRLSPIFALTRMSEIAPPGSRLMPVDALRALPGGVRLVDQAVRQAGHLFAAQEAEARALAYILANIAEAPHVTARWPTGIFFHIGPPELKLMLPSLPVLHGYAGPDARTRKPWFS